MAYFYLAIAILSEVLGTSMLKASDGAFDSLKVLRVIASVGDATQLTGRKITGSYGRHDENG